MVLRVDFSDFVESVRRIAGDVPVFVSARSASCIVTAADPTRQIIVTSVSAMTLEETQAKLQEAELSVHKGEWSLDLDATEQGTACDLTVAAVAYETTEDRPGLWVDAWEAPPAISQVLLACYEEFTSHGEITEMSFEEFVRVAKPNVVIVSPDEQRDFVRQREARELS